MCSNWEWNYWDHDCFINKKIKPGSPSDDILQEVSCLRLKRQQKDDHKPSSTRILAALRLRK
jgi:hypothetical protein